LFLCTVQTWADRGGNANSNEFEYRGFTDTFKLRHGFVKIYCGNIKKSAETLK